MSSRKYYYYRRPIGEPSGTDMPVCRPIEDLDLLHRRLKCPIGDRHAESNRNFNEFEYYVFHTYNFCLFIYIGIIYLCMSVSDGSPMKYVDVSDGSPIRHVGLRWGSDGSLRGLRCVSDNNNIVVNSLKICVYFRSY